MLLGTSDTSWTAMKKFLGNRASEEDILAFDARTLTVGLRAQVTAVMKAKVRGARGGGMEPSWNIREGIATSALSTTRRTRCAPPAPSQAESFEQATIYRASIAAAPLAAWVKAQIKYSTVLEAHPAARGRAGRRDAGAAGLAAGPRAQQGGARGDRCQGRPPQDGASREKGGSLGAPQLRSPSVALAAARRSSGRARPRPRRSSRRWRARRTRCGAPTLCSGSSLASADRWKARVEELTRAQAVLPIQVRAQMCTGWLHAHVCCAG